MLVSKIVSFWPHHIFNVGAICNTLIGKCIFDNAIYQNGMMRVRRRYDKWADIYSKAQNISLCY